MMTGFYLLGALAVLFLSVGSHLSAQPAILPHGDPRLADDEQQRERSNEPRDRRLKQQGQEPHDRIEGVPQPEVNRPDEEDRRERGPGPGLRRQDTGIADPSTNPGQARGMQTVEGRVLRQQEGRYVIEDARGGEVALLVDAYTTGDTELEPGDYIESTITPQGRAVTITKDLRNR